jgi:hypothetical protein
MELCRLLVPGAVDPSVGRDGQDTHLLYKVHSQRYYRAVTILYHTLTKKYMGGRMYSCQKLISKK